MSSENDEWDSDALDDSGSEKKRKRRNLKNRSSRKKQKKEEEYSDLDGIQVVGEVVQAPKTGKGIYADTLF
jgi:hypothetical protein